MRTLITVLLVIGVLAGAVLMGCAPGEDVTPPTDGDATPSPDGDEEPTPAQPEGEPVRWNLQASYPEASYLSESAIKFCDEIAVVTGGQMDVTFFGSGGIAPATEEFDATSANAIQMAMTSFGYNADKWPHGVILDAKPGTMSHLSARMWWDIYGGIELAEEMIEGHNVVPLKGPAIKTPEPFLSTSKEINSMGDLQGLRVRAYGDSGKLLEQLGASVLYLPASEVYESMQRGVIDGFEMGTPAGDYQAATHEVIDYMYLGQVRAPYSISPFFVNADEWNALPDHLRAAVQHTLSSVTDEWNGQLLLRDLEAMEEFKDAGVEIRPIPRDIYEATVDTIDDMYAEVAAEDPFIARVLDSLDQFETMFNDSLTLHRGEEIA